MPLKRKRRSSDSDEESIPRSLNKSYGEGDSSYQAAVFSPTESNEILRQLDEEILFLPRESFPFQIFSKVQPLPRDKAFFGDVQPDGSYPIYRYDARKDAIYPEVKAWPAVLERLRDRLTEITGQRSNYCLVNQYRDNRDHIGFHFDSTRDLVGESRVLTLSFGGERILRLKHNRTGAKEDIPLQSGSLFSLGWKTNSVWKHSIIKTTKFCARRISLTFRLLKTMQHPDGTHTNI